MYIFVTTTHQKNDERQYFSCHDTYKDMKSTITIEPATEEIRLMALSVDIKNKFAQKGCLTRSEFISTVQNHNSRYLDYKMVGRLETWWLGRIRDQELNNDLQIILNLI